VWLHFGEDPDPPNRTKLLLLTMREVALVGPATFNTMGVCDALGISYPMVNYYFGNRDGLIAEAGHLTYLRYVQKLWDGVEAAPRTPEERLLAWMHAHLRLNVEIRGWGAVLNYPRFSATIEEILDERFGAEHRRHFELNMARLTRLILDVREGSVSDFPFGVDDFPREEMLAQDEVVKVAATISWATLGLAVWRSGRHTPSKGIPELEQQGEKFVAAHFATLLALAKGDRRD
jgi:AcrR family transcriptional regulator